MMSQGRTRRDILKLGAAGAALLATPAAPAAKVRTRAHIVIAGSGAGGIAVANRLARGLEGARITIIDGRQQHYYQPGWTMVAGGVWPMERTVEQSNARFHPHGIEWVRDFVAEFDPAANTVVTRGGQRIRYDFLVVATGLQLNYTAIAGMDEAALGQNGLTSVYASPQAAADTWRLMDTFRRTGGRAVMTMPNTPMKCAGAPLKVTFLLDDRLREAGSRARSQVNFYAGGNALFGVRVYHDDITRRFGELGIQTQTEQRLTGIDIGARRATFTAADNSRSTVDYDFIHVVPPMSAPDAVRNSELSWKEGPFAGGGWLEVDRETLRHRRFPNVFGIGDVNGTPRGKTAATVKGGAPIVAENLMRVIQDQDPGSKFNGYTSCPLIVRVGSALLVEFDHDGKLVPSIPFVDPLQESYFAWVMKVYMLKPAYIAVLRGRV
jgi:sulfide:quinone oxidoreductase